MNRGEEAARRFYEGCNCCQAVVVTFCDRLGMEEETAMRLVSGLGGGMGRLREVCGAVTGAFLVLSWVYGSGQVPTQKEKSELYLRIQEYAARFREQTGSIVCREMLKGIVTDRTNLPEPRTPEYYKKRPCARTVALAADLLEAYLADDP